MSEQDYVRAQCPLPDCGEDLHLTWHQGRPVYLYDLGVADKGIEADSAHTQNWEIICEGGHTVMVPGEAYCPCDADDCPHDDQFDNSDEFRVFMPRDVRRLRELIEWGGR